MKKIVQCVPNFSEGKDEGIINKIIKPLQNQKGFTLVSVEPDKDYNRTVVTLLGDPEAMLAPLLAFFREAQQLIDMNNHKGEHPRMGAVDVVPFIPLSNISMEECVSYAKRLSESVNKELNIPVFLYAKAATQPERVSLPAIRKGEFEGMLAKMQEPLWYPDYGTNSIHQTFGAVAIGARMPLIAYNIDLPTNDESVARSIARAIRKSGGGFQYVQAGPALLAERGHVQVTMNILNYEVNPLYRIFEVVKMEARRYNLEVSTSEIIGLIPKATLVESLNYYLAPLNESVSLSTSLKEIAALSVKHLGFREFDEQKIIESYLEGSK